MSLVAVSSNVLYCAADFKNWYVDNGATNHITNQRDVFQSYLPFNADQKLSTANEDAVPALGQGTVIVQSLVNGKKKELVLNNVWYVPNIKKNLFSTLSAQDKNPNSEFLSTTECCYFKISNETVLVGSRCQSGGLYKLAMRAIQPENPCVNMLDSKENILQLYHERLGHQSKRHVKNVIKQELGIDVKLDSEICEGCIYGKSSVQKFGTRKRAETPGELIHSDVCGPFQRSKSGFQYFVLFKDDFSRYRYVYFLKQKSEVADKLEIVLQEMKAAEHCVKEMLSDHGGEFDNYRVANILSKQEIRQRLVMPYTPQQNGSSERDNRTIVECARSLMHAREGLFDQSFWAELINTASYILNRSGVSSISGKSPYEVWYNKKPDLNI